MEYFAGKVDSNKKVFPDSMSLAKKLKQHLGCVVLDIV